MTQKKKKKKIKSKQRKKNFINWWNKNGAKIFLFWLIYPVRFLAKIHDKNSNKRYNNLAYSDEYTKKLLDKVMVLYITKCSTEREIIFSTDEYTGDCYISPYKNLFRPLRKNKYENYGWKFSNEIFDYFVNRYELVGYKKIVYNNSNREEVAKKFQWKYPGYDDGVIFYKEDQIPLFFFYTRLIRTRLVDG